MKRNENIANRFITIQWLRALAAWMVVFHHYMQVYRDFAPVNKIEALFAHYGHLGVDIFFVLSGFIMSYSITKRQPQALEFLKNRIIRIVPAYWCATAVLLLVLPLATWESIAFLQHIDVFRVIASLLFIPHQHASEFGYFPVLTVGWTLNYEMYFYALLAILIYVGRRTALWGAIPVIFALPIISAYLVDLGPILSNWIIYEFAIGIAIHLALFVLLNINNIRPSIRNLAAVMCLLIAAVCLFLRFEGFRYALSAFVVLGFVLLNGVSFNWRWGKWNLEIGRFLSHLGDLSYSTYLFHVPVLILIGAFMERSRENDILLLPLVIMGTYVVSLMSYRFVEMNMQHARQDRQARCS